MLEDATLITSGPNGQVEIRCYPDRCLLGTADTVEDAHRLEGQLIDRHDCSQTVISD